MPQLKINDCPVTLHAEGKKSLPSTSSKEPSTKICMIITANAEISFYDGEDEHIIQTVKWELIHL